MRDYLGSIGALVFGVILCVFAFAFVASCVGLPLSRVAY